MAPTRSDRRDFLLRSGAVLAAAGGASVLAGSGGVAAASALVSSDNDDEPRPADPDAAIARLVAGNRRFVANEPQNPRKTAEHREAVTTGQAPFAAVLACSDSRVPIETIFDQGIGDLFVVRVAGNVAGADEVASLAYAAQQLGVEVIVVLGHEDCGAVKATISIVDGEAEAGEYAAFTDEIAPAVVTAQQTGATGKKLLGEAIAENVRLGVKEVPARSALIAAEIAARDIAVVGSVYHLKTGKVDFLP